MSSNDNSWKELALPDLFRRLQNIIRPGYVSAVDYAKARIRVKFSENLESNWIPWHSGRAGGTKNWDAPELGEQVVMLSPSGDTSMAIALVGIFSNDNPANGDSADVFRKTFKDGTVIEYDCAAHAMKAKIASNGTAEIEAPGGLAIKGDVSIDGNVSISKQLDVREDITSMGEVTAMKAGAPVNETTHKHTHPYGPTDSPIPGT